MDQSPQTGRRPIGKTISSYEPIGIVGMYYVLSFVCYVLELVKLSFEITQTLFNPYHNFFQQTNLTGESRQIVKENLHLIQ